MNSQKLNLLKENTENLNLSDFLIVTKINEKQLNNEVESKDEILLSEVDKEQEKLLLAAEHEAIVKKQQQILLADERGKQAIIAEIADIKQKQEKRAEALRNRRQALDIEKERSKWIASLPPPLPKSIKSLLRKHDDESKICSKPVVKMPDELTAVTITGNQKMSEENKENILDPEEIEAKRRMQEERDIKAQKRFTEALRKDRQKEEYAKLLKQLQNAELHNRHEMAKSISSEKTKTVPCVRSDKFQTIKNQADMEDAAERILRTTNKEHAIEDIEGYEDYYEVKYKNIDSQFEEKMIDCVPKFVKESYDYLLEDDSKFQGGKRFSSLNESGSDVLNQAYIETPPYDEDGEKIDLAIEKLDQLRSELQTEYDQTVKPLLIAAMELPEKHSADKAVETEYSQPLAEDKAVETEWPTSLSHGVYPIRPIFKRRQLGPFLPPYEARSIPDLHHKKLYFPTPSHINESSTPSWASSSHCSLPSKHGFPNIPGSAESVKCDICAAERNIQKHMSKVSDDHPISPSSEYDNKEHDLSDFKSDSASAKPFPEKKAYLTKYVKQLAKKYLEESITDSLNNDIEGHFSEPLSTVSSAFEKKKLDSDEIEKYRSLKSVSSSEKRYEHNALHADSDDVFHDGIPLFKKNIAISEIDSLIEKQESADVHDQIDTFNHILPTINNISGITSEHHKERTNDDFVNSFDDLFELDNKHEENFNNSVDEKQPSEYESEVERLQLIKQILSRRLPKFNVNNSPRFDNAGNTDIETPVSFENQRGLSEKPHVYHELSTIHEADSALTAGSLHLSRSFEKSQEKCGQEKSVCEKFDRSIEKSVDKLKSISLLDPPSPEISELAKNIQFVSDAKKAEVVPEESLLTYRKKVFTPSPMSNSDLSSSSLSTGKVLTSSLTGKYGNNPFLQSTSTLPKYYSDISGIKSKDFTSPNSFKSVASENSDVTPQGANAKLSLASLIDSKRKQVRNGKDSSNSHTLMSGFISTAGLSLNEMNDPTLSEGHLSGFSENRNVQHQYTDLKYGNTSNNGLISDFNSQYHLSSFSSSCSFHPMTPQADVSTPDTNRFSNEGQEGNRIPVAKSSLKSLNTQDDECKKNHLHDYTSNCELVSGFISKLNQVSASSESFYPMTPQSDVSSPSMKVISRNTLTSSNHDRKYDLNSPTSVYNESYKPMTPHSNVSTPSNQPFDYKNDADSKGSFKPLTPHSDVSTLCVTPSSALIHANYADSSAESFKPMSPKSMVSSPSYSSDDAAMNVKKPTENSEFKDFISHFDASQARNLKQKSSTVLPSIADNLKHIVPELKKQTEVSNSNFKYQDKASDEALSEQPNHAFANMLVPKNCANVRNSKCHLKTDSVTEPGTEEHMKIESDLRKVLHLLTSSQSDKECSSGSEPQEIVHNLKEINDMQRQHQKSPNEQISSATSSSSENLSDMFSGSKINYQSTPIKSLEEEMEEEKLISDESLTLVTITHLPSTADSPEQFLNPSKTAASFQAVGHLVDSKDRILHLSESNCMTPIIENSQPSSLVNTPSNESPQLLGPANTPSMLSFLHHEMDCMQDTNNAENSLPVLKQNSASSKSEDLTPKYNEVQQSQKFRRHGYKQRTKRLWSNLEEVKKKNLAEERQKMMTINRLKAKEYAKKLTPKRKM